MTLTLECRLRLLWQAKLALLLQAANRVGRNKPIRATARIGVSGKQPNLPETPPRATRPVGKLRTGLDGLIPAYAVPGNQPRQLNIRSSQPGVQASPALQAKLALQNTLLIFFVFFVPFVDKHPF